MSPAETVLANLPEVRAAFAKSPGPVGAWSLLQGTCPALTAAMSINSFRSVAPVVLLTAERLHKGCTLPEATPATPTTTPRTFDGWSVQTDAKGYTRLHKKTGGKVRSLYIGKQWDEAKATALLHRLGTATGNPAHRALFAIPTPAVSASTALTAPRPLPEQTRITGDLELDAALWLVQVCKNAVDLATLDRATEGAKRLTTPANELDRRYGAFLASQGAHQLQAVFGSFDAANVARHVERARERIEWNAVAMAVFGSYEATEAPTEAEQMLTDTTPTTLPDGDYWHWKPEQITAVFAGSVNPTTLTEAVAEIRYWRWLYQVRRHARATRNPGQSFDDEPFLVQARGNYVERLLLELKPIDQAEAVLVADAVDEFEIDSERIIAVLRHLVGCP